MSFGIRLDASPNDISLPKVAKYGVHLIVEWRELIFCICKNLSPNGKFFDLLSFIQRESIVWTSAFAGSVDPCDCRCWGRPWTIFISGHINRKDFTLSATNLPPLSDYKMSGTPMKVKSFEMRAFASLFPVLLNIGAKRVNLLVWSW